MARPSLTRFGWLAGACLLILAGVACAAYIEENAGTQPGRDVTPPRPPMPIEPSPVPPPSGNHVAELADYLDRLELRPAVTCGRLAVFPLVLTRGPGLSGRWLTLDAALWGGSLKVSEKEGGGTVPYVHMENLSQADNIFIMAGEIISGGKQTRTLRDDVVLVPRQTVDVPVFCVEAHRWQGGGEFKPSGAAVPQSIQREMRQGAGQDAVWSGVAKNNAALGSENATGSLELGLKAPAVQRDLDAVRRAILPECPGEAVGYIFVDRRLGRALGAEFFGRSEIARTLLPKLIDAYAVDLVVRHKDERWNEPRADSAPAHEFLGRIRTAGSTYASTPGSGSGIRLRAGGLTGGGIAFERGLVHFGCQTDDPGRVEPMPIPMPRRVE